MKLKLLSLSLLLAALVSSCGPNQSNGESYNSNDYIHFMDIYDFVKELNESSVYGITIEYGYIGTAPEYTHIKTLESTEIKDIKYYLDILNDPLVEDENDICGGSYRTITYWSTLDTLCEITFSNNFIFANDKSYRLANDPYRLPDIVE